MYKQLQVPPEDSFPWGEGALGRPAAAGQGRNAALGAAPQLRSRTAAQASCGRGGEGRGGQCFCLGIHVFFEDGDNFDSSLAAPPSLKKNLGPVTPDVRAVHGGGP